MIIAGKNALYHKLVYEVRYEHGLIYLDRCGITTDRILQSNPDWVVQENAISPQGAALVNAVSGTQFNFGTRKYDFSLNQPVGKESALTKDDIELFISDVDSVCTIVHRELELKTFVREGFRVWYLFATESDEDSQKWISGLQAFRVADSVTRAFDGQLESESHVAVITTRDRKFRIAVNAVERLETLDLGTEALKTLPRSLPKGQRQALFKQAQVRRRVLSNPELAVMIDVDAFIEDPIEVVPIDFIQRSLQMIEDALLKALSGGVR